MRATQSLLPLWAAVFVAGASATMLFNKIEVPTGAAQHRITSASMAVLGGGTAPINNDPSNILDGGFWIITNTSGEFPARLYQSQSWKPITKIGSEEVGGRRGGWMLQSNVARAGGEPLESGPSPAIFCAPLSRRPWTQAGSAGVVGHCAA
jgi:hypothetical protein